MPKDALSEHPRRSSPDLAGSHASLPSISDLGDEYLQAGEPRTPSLASIHDCTENRDRPTHLSVPPSPSQHLIQSSMGNGRDELDAGHPSTSRHPSSVTFGSTTATQSNQPTQDGSDELSPSPDVAWEYRPTDETSLLSSKAQQPRRAAAYGSTLSTSRLDRATSSRAESPPTSPHASLRSPSTLRIRKKLAKTASFVGLRRAQSYDEGLGAGTTDVNVVSNGTRHWTASFSSVDWVHDAVKDASRSANIRNLARRNWRWKAFLIWDRLQGWLVVTIVGILTALVAFAIVRGEGWLFDLKEGYCAKPNGGWRLSRGFCCTGVEGTLPELASHSLAKSVLFPALARSGPAANLVNAESCDDWRTWESVLGPLIESKKKGSWARWVPLERYMIEYVLYTLVAVTLATLSSFLTITLTRSTDFETRRDVVLLTKVGEEETPGTRPRKVMYFAGGSGIPEIKTILSGFVIHGYLGGRTLFTKAVGLTLSVAAGLSLGKEGPMVHIASCIGNICSRLFIKYETNEGKRREILSAACAAGVAVAFGAPIGGVLFSLEEVSYFFPPKVMWRSFWAATVAVTCLKALDPFGTGKIVLFQVSYDTDWRFAELAVFVAIGAGMGIYGACFAKLNMLWSRHVRGGTWLRTHPIKEVALVTLMTAVLSFTNPLTHMAGGELVLVLVSECDPKRPSHLCVSKPSEIRSAVWAIAVAMVLKGFLTVVTFGIRLPAGVFVPTLAVGACFGRIVGLILHDLQSAKTGVLFSFLGFHSSKIEPGVYAMVGAAAALAGVTRTTVSLAVIVMELTGSLTYAVPVILGVLVAKTVADALEPKGIYDLVIELNQIPFLDAKESHGWGQLQVSDVLDAQAPILRCDRENSVASLTTLAANFNAAVGPDGGFPVLERTAGGLRMRGVLALNELEHVLARLQDQPEAICILRPRPQPRPRTSFYAQLSPFSADISIAPERDPLDLSAFIDQAPLTIQLHSPLELVQQLFVKLGVRSLVCLNEQGHYAGLISKARWLAFLDELHEH